MRIGGLLLAGLLAQDPAAAAGPGGATAEEARPSSAPVSVTTRVSPDPSLVGDLVELHVEASYPAGYSVNLPIGLDLGVVELVETRELEPEPSGDGLRREFVLVVQRFRTGDAKIRSFPLTYVDPSGEVQTVPVPATSFTVTSQLVNESDPRRVGEDPPISREYPNERAEIAIYASLLALLVGGLITFLVMRLRSRTREQVAPPPVPAHQRALAALDELERQRMQLLAEGGAQGYYLQLTDIAKAYLEGRFGVEASDRTTDEIRAALRRDATRIRPLVAGEVMALLDEFDLVKFARLSPEPEEAAEHLQQVRGMVERSVPAPAALDEAKEVGSGEGDPPTDGGGAGPGPRPEQEAAA